MKNLVPIKVKISLHDDTGHHKYPNFNLIDPSIRGGMDWSKYVDVRGLGWHYDQLSGHDKEDIGSPLGVQYGVLVIPEDFALAAISQFPSLCTRLNETELEDFYDNNAHIEEPDEKVDDEALKIYETKEKMKIILTPEEEAKKLKALDPNDPEPGIKVNRNKKWAMKKADAGINII